MKSEAPASSQFWIGSESATGAQEVSPASEGSERKGLASSAVGAALARLLLSLAFFAAGSLLASCGYHVVGRNDALPKSIHVIAIPALENKTTSYRIEQRLTAATIHEFLAATRYKVISNPESGADAVLRGKVLTVEAVPLLFITTPATATQPSTTRATTMLVTMKCDVTLTESASEKVLYHNDSFVFRNEYEISTDVKSFFEEQDPALDRMAQDFAKRLVAAVTENF